METTWDGAVALAGIALACLALRALAAAFEAALAAVGTPRAEALAAAPGAGTRARALGRLVAHPERTAAGVRLFVGITSLSAGALVALAALALPGALRAAWIGAGVVAAALVSVGLASAARRIGARHGEAVALALAPAVRVIQIPLAPLAAAAGLAVAPLAGGRGQFSLPLPPLEEMERKLAEWARQRDDPADRTSELVRRVFEFREKVARDVMLPRTDVVSVDVDTPVPEIIRILTEEGHSRMPVTQGSADQVVGILHARDLVPLLAHPDLIVLRDLIRPPLFVPWSKPVQALLRDMQRKHVHMMVVVDEYGGVMGVVTLEDVLEEIVGEIQDEWDVDEAKVVEALPDGTFAAQGAATVAEFNAATGAGVPEDGGYETVAGFLNSLAGAIPATGDKLAWRGWTFTVSEADRKRALRVRVLPPRRPG